MGEADVLMPEKVVESLLGENGDLIQVAMITMIVIMMVIMMVIMTGMVMMIMMTQNIFSSDWVAQLINMKMMMIIDHGDYDYHDDQDHDDHDNESKPILN